MSNIAIKLIAVSGLCFGLIVPTESLQAREGGEVDSRGISEHREARENQRENNELNDEGFLGNDFADADSTATSGSSFGDGGFLGNDFDDNEFDDSNMNVQGQTENKGKIKDATPTPNAETEIINNQAQAPQQANRPMKVPQQANRPMKIEPDCVKTKTCVAAPR